MAQYKVPQDVEAEDKFVGPLTFKQFLFGMATAVSGYICFLILTSPVPWLAIIFLPFFLVSLVFTIPWSRDQPTDLFLASRIRFLFMQRKRIWDQTGMKNLVTITVPKREVHYYTDGLTQDEVRSRFSALSSVIDSRGWAVKNAQKPIIDDSDRLVQPAAEQPTPEEIDAKRMPDVVEARSTQVDQMIKQSEEQHRQERIQQVEQAKKESITPGADTLTGSIPLPQVEPQHAAMKKKNKSKAKPKVVEKPGGQKLATTLTEDDEKKVLEKIHKKQDLQKSIKQHGHEKRIMTAKEKKEAAEKQAQEQAEMQRRQEEEQTASATPVNPDILWASQNNDRSIASLQREVGRDNPDDEVVVSLR